MEKIKLNLDVTEQGVLLVLILKAKHTRPLNQEQKRDVSILSSIKKPKLYKTRQFAFHYYEAFTIHQVLANSQGENPANIKTAILNIIMMIGKKL